MRGRVTMRGISRWSEGISYKTVERFFDKKIDWLSLKWQMIKRVIGEEVIHLISKLKKNASLYFKFRGEQKGRGRKRIYGELIDCQNIDKKYLKKTTIHKDIETKIYQFEALHKKVNASLNIVLIFSTNLKNKKTTHTILFSTDLEQDYEKTYSTTKRKNMLNL